MKNEAYTMYLFAKEFGYTPQQIRDLPMDDYHMLKFAFDEVQKEQEKQQNENDNKGGSQMNGQSKKITSMDELVGLARKESDCKISNKE